MSSASAVFIKQLQDIMKNSGVLIQFIIFPAMAFIMTYVVSLDTGGAFPESFFITMFAAMFVGMTLISTIATAIAEDREKNSLRFLLMAGVKSHEYLMGIGGVVLACAVVVGGSFAVMMPNISIVNKLVMLISVTLGAVASILLGAIIGMTSDNEQKAISISSAAGMLLGFGPMIAAMSGDKALETAFEFFYTANLVYGDILTASTVRSFGIILANIILLAIVFVWVYGKQEQAKKGVRIMSKKTVAGMLAVLILGGVGISFAIWHSAGFLSTDNARVTTNYITISANASGVLERFSAYEGQRVNQSMVLGWIQGGEAIRSPIDGLIVQANAVQNQFVSQSEALALIADTNNLHIEANIEETDISNVRVGQPVYVTLDGFGNQSFSGFVSVIGNVTQSELGGNPLSLNLGGDFSRRTHLVPIEIELTDEINLESIIGMNAKIRIPLR